MKLQGAFISANNVVLVFEDELSKSCHDICLRNGAGVCHELHLNETFTLLLTVIPSWADKYLDTKHREAVAAYNKKLEVTLITNLYPAIMKRRENKGGNRVKTAEIEKEDEMIDNPIKTAKQFGIAFEQDEDRSWLYGADGICWMGYYKSKHAAAIAALRDFGISSRYIRAAIYAGYIIYSYPDGTFVYQHEDEMHSFKDERFKSKEEAAQAVCVEYNLPMVDELVPGQPLKKHIFFDIEKVAKAEADFKKWQSSRNHTKRRKRVSS